MVNNELMLINEESIKDKIYVIRGIPVMLDRDLALIYGYSVKRLNEQVQRNIEKFPSDMMFQLSYTDIKVLWSQNATTNISPMSRSLPYAFTEQGIYMLMTVLKGELATKQSIELVRLFKRMKDYIVSNKGLLTNDEVINLLVTNINDIKRIDSTMATKDDVLFLTSEMNKIKDNFKDEKSIKDYIFLSNTRYEADELFRKLFSFATSSIIIIDNYIGVKNLYLLKDVKKGLKIGIFTSKKNLTKDKLNEIEYRDFKDDNKDINILIYDTKELIHDRIIILDYRTPKEKIYTLGSSIKDTGKKISILHELKYFDINRVLRKIINESESFWIQ